MSVWVINCRNNSGAGAAASSQIADTEGKRRAPPTMDQRSETHALTMASCDQKTTDAQLSNQSQRFRTESLPTKFGYQKILTRDWQWKKAVRGKIGVDSGTETYQYPAAGVA
jgi:hypothetical protein